MISINVHFKRHKAVWLTVAIVALLGVTCFFGRSAIYNQLDSWMLIPRPERLTELYFTDHTNLPAMYSIGKKQQLKFTVHNVEYRTTIYTYVVTQNSEDGKTSKKLAEGSFTLDQDQTKAIETTITSEDLGARAQIEVKLVFDGITFGADEPNQQGQAIHYWVNKEEL